MPNVTIDPGEFTRHDLKSAPPDGFVMLRPLPFGMKLARRDKALKMRMVSQRNQAKNADQVIDLETLSEWSTMYDFTYCIGEHNLQDKNGTLLDFGNQRTIEMVFRSLDPKVGSEIATYVDKLNEDEDEDLLEDLARRRGSSLEAEPITLPEDSNDTP